LLNENTICVITSVEYDFPRFRNKKYTRELATVPIFLNLTLKIVNASTNGFLKNKNKIKPQEEIDNEDEYILKVESEVPTPNKNIEDFNS